MAKVVARKKPNKKRISPKKSKLDYIHHIAIPVPDIATALEWHTSRFHCRVKYVDETWALLTFANTKLARVLPHEHPLHLALSRPDANRFGELVPHRDGLRSVYIKDGFGNAIEVLEEP